MIHVCPQPEPAAFDAKVRQKGLNSLHNAGLALDKPLPAGASIRPHWRKCLDDLHKAYDGICAYLCIYVERVTGAASVDHFVAKSSDLGLAYEWSNYRLACSSMNSRKGHCSQVLDPFEVVDGWFHLDLSTGHTYPNPQLPAPTQEQVDRTITKLKLDDAYCRSLRTDRFDAYIKGHVTEPYLKEKAPFVWLEAKRQDLL